MRRHTIALVLAGALACGSSDDDGPGASPQAGELGYKPCARGTEIGNFSVVVEEAVTTVQGQVYDAVSPRDALYKDGMRAAECRLVSRDEPVCNPECSSSQVCGAGGKCARANQARSVGTVTVTGLKVPLSMMASAPTYLYHNGATSLPHPAADEGAEIQLAGGGFALRGRGVAPLKTPESFSVEMGKGLKLTWTAGKPGVQRVHVEVNVNHHGTTNDWIECDVPDSGTYEVPAALMQGLIARGTSGFPTVVIERRTADSAALKEGCVEFLVTSGTEVDLKVPGVLSCKADDDCGGKTCRADQTCSK